VQRDENPSDIGDNMIKNKIIFSYKAIVLVLVILSMLALTIEVRNRLDLGCDRQNNLQLNSPDGAWRATEVYEECGGAVGGLVDEVTIQKNSKSVWWLSFVRVYSSNFSKGAGYLTFQWVGARELKISYPADVDVYEQAHQRNGITIYYDKVPD
jgi:hypothetical protein